MSAGQACTCTSPDRRNGWYVLHWRCNYSAFNGYRYTPSDYSAIRCVTCNNLWRTKASYADTLPKGPSVLR